MGDATTTMTTATTTTAITTKTTTTTAITTTAKTAKNYMKINTWSRLASIGPRSTRSSLFLLKPPAKTTNDPRMEPDATYRRHKGGSDGGDDGGKDALMEARMRRH